MRSLIHLSIERNPAESAVALGDRRRMYIMKKLWQKENENINSVVEKFETKDDIVLDNHLTTYDIQGSLAHAKMLEKIGVLNKKELAQLEKGLEEILKLDQKGKFLLEQDDEDIHTKIENYLTEKYGEVGKKIHTGRSRNDQVLTVLRLYSKDHLEKVKKELVKLINIFSAFKKAYGDLPMPGYTHMQKAMPTTVGVWMQSFIDSFTDDMQIITNTYDLIDQSPLGSAAGFGTTLDLDRDYTAKLLGFKKVQENPIYCQNSKGKFEATIISSLIPVMQTVNKLSSDIMLFTTQEFHFFTVSDQITTGSSIMPQKKNVDIAELLRSKVHILLGYYVQIVSMSSNLISGYNRDLQDVKKPLMESFATTLGSLQVTGILLQNITPNKEVLKQAMTDDLFATEKVMELVKKGIPFREAYQKIKKSMEGQ